MLSTFRQMSRNLCSSENHIPGTPKLQLSRIPTGRRVGSRGTQSLSSRITVASIESSMYIALNASSLQEGKALPLIGTSTGTCGPSYFMQLHIPKMSKSGEQIAGLTTEATGLNKVVEAVAEATVFAGTNSVARGLNLCFTASALNKGHGLVHSGGGGHEEGPGVEATLEFKPVSGVGETGSVP